LHFHSYGKNFQKGQECCENATSKVGKPQQKKKKKNFRRRRRRFPLLSLGSLLNMLPDSVVGIPAEHVALEETLGF
jgi:hypothetical protein